VGGLRTEAWSAEVPRPGRAESGARSRGAPVRAAAPRGSGAGRMTSRNRRPMATTAIPLSPRPIHVLTFDGGEESSAASTAGRRGRRSGPLRSLAGIQRVTYTKASDAHTGHSGCSCNSSQSRQTRAFRSCISTSLRQMLTPWSSLKTTRSANGATNATFFDWGE
jgi:hypothetical protein